MRVFKRSGSWYLDVNLDGRRVRRLIKGAKTRSEAQAALTAVQADILRGQFNFKSEKKILFDDFAELYFERHSKPNKRSWKRDVTSIKALSGHFKGMPLSKITPFLIESYKLKRKEQVEVSSLNRELACLKNMFTKAIDWGFALENPVKKVKLFNEENRERWRILSSEEISALLSHCRSPLKETVLLALNTGMRIGEIMALRWDDVDFLNEYILIRDSKSGRSRKVPLNEIAKNALLSLREATGAYEFVFYNPRTRTYTKYPRKAFWNACRKAGISSLCFHDLRHHAASAMVQAGVDLHTVSKILGHSTIKLTMRYSHPGFDHTKNAVKALERIFDGKPAFEEKNGTNMAQAKTIIPATYRNKMISGTSQGDS
ncbi:MAG: tyrosine-type recombinase/integrase [Candidatus Aminicenantales bacterium]